MRLVMFDVDGTLILSDHAGMRAFYRAFQDTFQVPVEREVVRPDGKTDPRIAREMVAFFGLEASWTEQTREALLSSYLQYLEVEMRLVAEKGTLRVLPGVVDLLDTLARRNDFMLGLATGNLQAGTQIKLRQAGLDQYFRFGGFGSDSDDRTELILRGVRRGTELCAPLPVDAAFVVGDTPLDIIHGHEAGTRVLAVASGRYSIPDMEPFHPEMLMSDLTDTGAILSFFLSQSRTGSPRAVV